MATVQLNVRVDEALAARLKAEAKRRHAMPGALVAQAIEQFLSNDGRPLGNATEQLGGQWQKEVERRLTALEAKAKATPAPAAAPAAAPPPAPKAPPAAAPTIPQMGDAITSAELAARLGMKRHAFNERVRRAGGAREGAVMEGWRCVGQTRPANGGPLQWLWRLD